MRINRAQLREKPLDADCKKAHTTSHELGDWDERVFCYGIADCMTDEPLKKCKLCGAFVDKIEDFYTLKIAWY